MAQFKTNLEVIMASEEHVEIYYQAAAKKINLLLEKYSIRNAKDQFETVSSDKLRSLLSFTGFLQATPLESIFLDQKQQFVPHGIIHAFRNIISAPPINIKAFFLNSFITLLTEKGWKGALGAYFEKQYNVLADSIIILEDLQDFSLGFGVYRATFQLRTFYKEKIIVFLKRADETAAYNELFYHYLQKELLLTARYAGIPYLLSNKENQEALLLSPLISGVTSDTALSILKQAYTKTSNYHHRLIFKKSLEIIIEAFFSHAVLGDLLGRNDRHLMNSLIAFTVDGIPQKNTLEDLLHPEKILVYAKNIVARKTRAISLIDIDLKWLLGEKNADWSLVDIDFGLSEINLLSLLPEFNDYSVTTNPFFEKRKDHVVHYFTVYCQQQETILARKALLFSAITKIYPFNIADNKLKILIQKIHCFEQGKTPVIKIFKRYLLNFRTRLAHKVTLIALDKFAREYRNINLSNALKETGLLNYLPPRSEPGVFLQLQCFRGVLSRKDKVILSEKERVSWETIASRISMITKKFNYKLFKDLKDKKQFIKKDTAVLLKALFREVKTSHSCIREKSALESCELKATVL